MRGHSLVLQTETPWVTQEVGFYHFCVLSSHPPKYTSVSKGATVWETSPPLFLLTPFSADI